jgi:internalin A
MTVRAWDFVGQEVCRMITHQFFITPRALYMVVWNARKGQEQDLIEGWLRRVRLRVSRDARVLLVAGTPCLGLSPWRGR